MAEEAVRIIIFCWPISDLKGSFHPEKNLMKSSSTRANAGGKSGEVL